MDKLFSRLADDDRRIAEDHLRQLVSVRAENMTLRGKIKKQRNNHAVCATALLIALVAAGAFAGLATATIVCLDSRLEQAQAQLDAYANTWAAANTDPVTLPAITLRADTLNAGGVATLRLAGSYSGEYDGHGGAAFGVAAATLVAHRTAIDEAIASLTSAARPSPYADDVLRIQEIPEILDEASVLPADVVETPACRTSLTLVADRWATLSLCD